MEVAKEPGRVDDGLGADRSIPVFLRHTAVSGIAGVLTGFLVGGIGGRLVMLVSALAAGDDARGALTENGNVVGEFSLVGTVELIVFIGGGFGAIGAIVWIAGEPWLRRTGRWQGVTFGALLLALGGTEVFDSSSADFDLLDPTWLNVALFTWLFLAFGPVFVVIRRSLDSVMPGRTTISRTVAIEYLILILPGVPLVLITYATLLASEFCVGCGPSVLPAGIAFSAVSVMTVLVYGRTAGAQTRSVRVERLGSLFLAVTIVVGWIIVGREIIEITT